MAWHLLVLFLTRTSRQHCPRLYYYILLQGEPPAGGSESTSRLDPQIALAPVAAMPHEMEASIPAAAVPALDEKLTKADTVALTTETLPYWLVNVPRSQWPAECPSFLQNQSPKNIKILSTPDEHYKRQDWEMVKEIIS